ncbi:TetR/AcrR family transcriptional regulator, partial [Mycolicibacterium psychrotolerans]|uniref:TetR/AcrR family transcriptional regulator n=1 Tax=Mycolicibacterium psychrotolerans TaxID=216929 RepID=UPI0021F3BDC9
MAATSYHHGNLRQTLLDHGVALARAGGPDAVVLRDVQRLAGVSNSAAYRHYADRRALLGAVQIHAMTQLGEAMRDAVAAVPNRGPRDRRALAVAAVPNRGPRDRRALARLSATGRAYVDFALAEPGLFRTAFAKDGPDRADA